MRLFILLLITTSLCYGETSLESLNICQYNQYSGVARVLSIQKTAVSKAQKNHAGFEGYEILFKLNVKTEVKKPYLFLLNNGWYPGKAYIKKYGIKIGQKYPGILKIRKSGNCPRPIFFDEPSLKKDDYFEGYLSDPVTKPNRLQIIVEKPVLYLYPKTKETITITLRHPEKISVSYPKYPKNGWTVTAHPNGVLVDQKTGEKYYSLFWELVDQPKFTPTDGSVIKKKDTATFLDVQLKKLGLNWRERNEFIIYWLPKLAQNNQNQIRFYTQEYGAAYPIGISPKPDTLIRVYMVYSKTTKFTQNKEIKKFKPVKRNGFTAVEWGGSEIK